MIMTDFFKQLEHEGIIFPEAEQHKVRLSVHQSGSTLYIDDFFIPEAYRGNRFGTKLFDCLIKNLPPEVVVIELFAADYEGNGNSHEFWDVLGFDYKYTSDDENELSYEDSWTMILGVNGHETPMAISYND